MAKPQPCDIVPKDLENQDNPINNIKKINIEIIQYSNFIKQNSDNIFLEKIEIIIFKLELF